ncbi:MAG: urate hydroxylase PuuD [Acidimicrobiales bacterium]|nr:urate hydroxylase PuuD [Acidimicrobiales bacterium]
MLAEYLGFFSRNGLGTFGFRWLHILVGIMWIGLLYYFNFVQVPAFAAFGDEAKARNIAIDKVARKALWWFRWAAFSTFVTGILITVVTENYFYDGFGKSAGGIGISVGMLLGTIMMLNVWGVIWRNQKVVLANAANLLAGGEADPNAAAAGRKALMASRQNTIFSVSMLFFMVYKGHGLTQGAELGGGAMGAFWLITLVLIGVLEANALGLMPWKTQPNKGLNILYDGPGVRNPLVAAFGLWVIFLILTEIFFKF